VQMPRRSTNAALLGDGHDLAEVMQLHGARRAIPTTYH
jgi:hypothetical protein